MALAVRANIQLQYSIGVLHFHNSRPHFIRPEEAIDLSSTVTKHYKSRCKSATVYLSLFVNRFAKGSMNSEDHKSVLKIKTHDSVVRPKEPACHTVSILTGRKKTQFSHLCSSVIPYPIGTKFATDVPASYGSLHTKFEESRSSHFRDTSKQTVILISSFFSSSTSFCTLCKIHHKTRMHAPIGLKFGTLEGLIKADLSTNFGRNPINIQGVMID